VLAVDQRGAARRRVEPEHDAHRGGLAGAVRAQEPGDDARLDGEGQVLDGDLLAVALRDMVDFDHVTMIGAAGRADHRS
jgi:hypothetical protein